MKWMFWKYFGKKKEKRHSVEDLFLKVNELSETVSPQLDELVTLLQGDKKAYSEGLERIENKCTDVCGKLDWVIRQFSRKEEEDVNKSQNSYSRLMELCADLIAEMESVEERMRTPESKDMIAFVKGRLLDSMLLSGGSYISEESEFDILRHEPVPMAFVKDGSIIEETLRPGMTVGKRVFLKAKVRVRKEDI